MPARCADIKPPGVGESPGSSSAASPGSSAAASQQGNSGGVQKTANKPVTFVTSPDAGGRVHPEYAKLAEERLKAATNRIVYLESEVGQLNKRWADEKVKTSLIEQKVVKLNDRVAQVKRTQECDTRTPTQEKHTHSHQSCLRRRIRPLGMCVYGQEHTYHATRVCGLGAGQRAPGQDEAAGGGNEAATGSRLQRAD